MVVCEFEISLIRFRFGDCYILHANSKPRMKIQNQIIKMSKLVSHMKSDETTTQHISMQDLDISRRTFFRYIEDLRELGAEIRFSRAKGGYVINEEFDLMQSLFAEVLEV